MSDGDADELEIVRSLNHMQESFSLLQQRLLEFSAEVTLLLADMEAAADKRRKRHEFKD